MATLDEYGNDIELMKQYGQVDFEETENHSVNCKCVDCLPVPVVLQHDKFQPLAVVQKLDAMRSEFTQQSAQYFKDHPEFVNGVTVALIWARVEVMAMATAKDRFVTSE